MTLLTQPPTGAPPPRPQAFSAAAGVVLQSPLYGSASSAQETRWLAQGLARAGLPLRLAPADEFTDAHGALAPAVAEQLERLPQERLDLARSVLYCAAAPPWWNREVRGRARVGRVSYWTDRLPRSWREPCQELNEIWVPGEFHREILAAAGLPAAQLRLLPTAVDAALFHPQAAPLALPGAKGFNFLAVSNLHERQGTELLLEAFLQEFQADEDVALWLKIAPHAAPQVPLEAALSFFIERQARLPLEHCPTILLLDEAVTPETMAALYVSAQAFVRPYYGAGQGRALLEALSCGLPVIATGWGGPGDFLRAENSYLIETEGLVPAAAGAEFAVGHRWAQPSRAHLRRQLRAVFTQREPARARGRRGRRDILAHWDCGVLWPRWEQVFRELLP